MKAVVSGFINRIRFLIFTALLGAFAGAVIWCFLKAVSICTGLIWNRLPSVTGISWSPLVVCIAGGLIVGLLHRCFGDYPDELQDVMGKIKKDRYYDYHPMGIMLVCAFFPLVCGASVGPEAGLTGIIAALCYWVGDNVTFAKNNTDMFSEIGEAVTLGQLFHSPLFGIMAVEESEGGTDENPVKGLSKGNKLLLYGISTVSGLFTAFILNELFGAAMGGFPAFSDVPAGKDDYLTSLIYIPAGILLYEIFELSEKCLKGLSGRIPVIVKETLCATITGVIGIVLPMAAFSGEEEMGELMVSFVSYSPLFLAGICIIKILLTVFCINFGMKGGHFFPLIFACTSMGMALSSLCFSGDPLSHAAFAAATVTAVVLGAQLKKPFTVSLLLLLCFPVKILFWIFLCAVLGSRIPSPFTSKEKIEHV